ncbi:MAG TPA: phosphotransferase [Acidisoma sp.]|uniref:phosphotransferase n=1 Tax=Acidisoma sp. TaxID=1872115 RepID=UPI002BA589FD|nr:phosphotransferase [Acidisoma sp.]HTI03648.1 phosphotransferase [Acidisoma sp.]
MDSRFTEACPPVTEAQAESFAQEAYGIAAVARPLGSERDANFELQTPAGASYLLKITHPGEAPEVTKFQTDCLLHLADVDPTLPVPRVILTPDGQSVVRADWAGVARTTRLLSFLPGMPLHLAEREAAQRRRIGTTLAALDRGLGSFPGAMPKLDLIWDMGQAVSLRPLIAHVADPAEHALIAERFDIFEGRVLPALAALPQQPIHNDFNPHNLLVDPEDHRRISGIIDFGDLAVAPRVQDLAVAASYQVLGAAHPFETAAETVAGFHAETQLSEPEIALLADLIPMRLALAITISNWRAALHPENRDYILRNVGNSRRGLVALGGVGRAEAEDYLNAACRGA